MTKFEPNLAAAAASILKPNAASGVLQQADVDVAVIGAGFAGSLAALSLARLGYSTTVVDPYADYPTDFRCEKFSADQAALLEELGAAELFRRDALLGPSVGGLTGAGLRYDQMVNALRGAWPQSVDFRVGKVMDIVPDRTGATLTLAGGETIRCRLAILATGPGEKLRAGLGLARQVHSPSHSVTLGFDIEAEDGGELDIDGLIHRGEHAGDGVGYVSFFRLGAAQRHHVRRQ
jgi:2-polyprenyl-6-methoxyphenol hydroxylase-like FAD-dependent oxidoreductase